MLNLDIFYIHNTWNLDIFYVRNTNVVPALCNM